MAKASERNQPVIIAGITMAVILLCVAGLFFVATRYRTAMTAYAWVQNANSETGDLDEMICDNGLQAERFNIAFRNRYGDGSRIEIDLSEFVQNDREVRFTGNIVSGDDSEEFEAIFHIGEDENNGFLGLFGCIERIEQLQPDMIPQEFWGR